MTAVTSALQRKVAFSACFGTFLEWYDFLTFATLAGYFSVLFFPADNPVVALLASLATFAVGMVVRPLGAAIFGYYGDKYGRRPAFIVTIALMGLTTFAVGLLPTYAQIGIVAPLLLLALRLLQGLALGGEFGGAAVYLTEHAPAARRGMFTSVLQLMGPLGIIASTLQIVALNHFLSEAEFREWGWRVPFLLSILLLAVSVKARFSLHESPVFEHLRQQHALASAPLKECFTDRRTLAHMGLLFFGVSAGGSLLFYVSQVYTGVFLKSVVKVDPAIASSLGLVATLALLPLIVLTGWWSDRVGRRPVMLAGLLLGAAALQPAFYGLLHFGNPALETFNRSVPVVVYGNDCHYNPFVPARNDCERVQDWLTKQGASYQRQASAQVHITIGETDVQGFDVPALQAALVQHAWPTTALKATINMPMIVLSLSVLVVALALVIGPQTALVSELFPARTRYSAVSLPHNLAAGWIGGLSPFMATLLSVRGGDVMAGLWYPNVLLIMALLVCWRFMPETRLTSLEE